MTMKSAVPEYLKAKSEVPLSSVELRTLGLTTRLLTSAKLVCKAADISILDASNVIEVAKLIILIGPK